MLTAIDAIILDIEEAKTILELLLKVNWLELNDKEEVTINELWERVDNIEQIKNTLYKLDI